MPKFIDSCKGTFLNIIPINSYFDCSHSLLLFEITEYFFLYLSLHVAWNTNLIENDDNKLNVLVDER